MLLDATLLACDGKQYLRDAMTDVVSYNVLDEEHRKPDAYDGIDKVEPVGTRLGELVRQQLFYLTDEPLQRQSRTGREDAHKETDEQDEVLVGEMPPAPSDEPSYEVSIVCQFDDQLFCLFLIF